MLKTRKSVSRRFRVNKNGKVKCASPGKGHLQTGKPRSQKRHLRKRLFLNDSDARRVRRYLPYG